MPFQVTCCNAVQARRSFRPDLDMAEQQTDCKDYHGSLRYQRQLEEYQSTCQGKHHHAIFLSLLLQEAKRYSGLHKRHPQGSLAGEEEMKRYQREIVQFAAGVKKYNEAAERVNELMMECDGAEDDNYLEALAYVSHLRLFSC